MTPKKSEEIPKLMEKHTSGAERKSEEGLKQVRKSQKKVRRKSGFSKKRKVQLARGVRSIRTWMPTHFTMWQETVYSLEQLLWSYVYQR
jgi:hypothetical protein